MASPNPFLTAALSYAARGWRVVPLKPRAKGPWLMDWVNTASTDPEKIRAWWEEYPKGNVGVALGEATGLVGVDVDSESGMERLLAMSEGDLPPTCEIVTGKGSRFLFAIPPDLGFELTQVVLKDGNGAEELRLQAHRGQCVLPPSIHPNGKTYQWVEGRSPDDLPPALMPAWLVEQMRPADKAVAISAPPLAPSPAPIPQYAPVESETYNSGGDFNLRGSWWHDILEPAGFKAAGSGPGGSLRYTRPGKADGVSVTLGFCKARDGSDALYVFSGSIAELPAGHSYDKFGAFARIYHGGNFKLAAQALSAKGYGTPKVGGPNSPAPSANPSTQPNTAIKKPGKGIMASTLVKTDFPPIKYALDGLLIEGLTFLAGRPKKGKSWFSLEIGWAVAAGYTLDGRKTTQGDVLYLALEDTQRRLKGRILQMQKGRPDWKVPDALHLHTEWRRAADGGLQHLGEWIQEHKSSARLIIIDTLAKFRTPPKGTANGYAEDYEAVAGIKGLADTYGCSVLVVHHTRKMKAEDPFDELSGTLGLTGAADATWVLENGGDRSGELFITGRDIPESTIPMTFDSESCCWRLGETIEGVKQGGRVNVKTPTAEKREQCKVWLLDFLSEFAFPSDEIKKSAEIAGYGWTALRDAKVDLGRQGSKQVTNHNFRTDGKNDWWSGIGPVSEWVFRPGPGIPPGFGKLGSQESQEVRKRRNQTAERGSPGESESQESELF